MVVAVAHAVAAMPEQPTPPAVYLGGAAFTDALPTISQAVFILYVLVAPVAASILNSMEVK